MNKHRVVNASYTIRNRKSSNLSWFLRTLYIHRYSLNCSTIQILFNKKWTEKSLSCDCNDHVYDKNNDILQVINQLELQMLNCLLLINVQVNQ